MSACICASNFKSYDRLNKNIHTVHMLIFFNLDYAIAKKYFEHEKILKNMQTYVSKCPSENHFKGFPIQDPKKSQCKYIYMSLLRE